MKNNRFGGKFMLIGGSFILLALILASLIGLFFFRKSNPEVKPQEDVATTYETKDTKDLVSKYSPPKEEVVNKDYSHLGVSAILSDKEYKDKVESSSTVLKSGFVDVESVDKEAVFSLVNKAFSEIIVEEPTKGSYGSASPALSQYTVILNNYFGGSKDNPMSSLSLLLTSVKSKVNIVNLSKTSIEGKIAFEFVIEDLEGNQLAYVTGYFGDYTKRFEVTDAFLLGYGQEYVNENIPKHMPVKQGLD